MDRDAFIAALIGELNHQKNVKGNNENFFTGKDLTASDVYHKLCFDFPLVNEEMLTLFLTALTTSWESSQDKEKKTNTLMSDDFRSTFTLHKKLLYNLATLHDSSTSSSSSSSSSLEGLSTIHTSTTASMNKKQELTSCISAELYMNLPFAILDLSFEELTALFHIQSTSASVMRSEVLEDFRSFLCNMPISQIISSTPSEYLAERGLKVKSLRFLDKLIALYDKMQQSSQLTTTNDKSRHLLHLVEYVFGPMNQECLEEEREYRLKWLKDLISQTSSLLVEILCSFPQLLPSVFAGFCKVHMGSKKDAVVDIFSLQPSIPSLSQYLLLVGISRLSQRFSQLNKKERGEGVLAIRVAINSIRSYLSTGQNLRDMVDLCQLIRSHNQPTTTPLGTKAQLNSCGTEIVDLESVDFLVDITLLLVPTNIPPAICPAYDVNALVERIQSSRLLPILVSSFVQATQLYLQYQNNPIVKAHDAQYWSLSVRLTIALARFCFWHSQLAAFCNASPPLKEIWTLLQQTLHDDEKSARLLANGGSCRVGLILTVIVSILFRLQQGPTAAGQLNLELLCQTAVHGMGFMTREIDEVGSVLSLLQLRESREEERENNPDAPPSAPLSSGDQINQYMRSLEALEVSCHVLEREDLSSLLAIFARTPSMEQFLVSYREGWRAVLKTATSIKNRLRQTSGDSHQMLIGMLERCIRSSKSLLSILEGGATSKSD
eukprot:scaffold183_cov174-Ochromonas_danica.AAC.3